MKRFDVFISYAIEDKHPVAAAIANGLKDAGLKVYFVGNELEPGDLISDTVFNGLEHSRFCVLILSTHYVRKWPAIERSHILRREKKTGKTLVFPVWSKISQEDVARFFPELADHYALSADKGLEQVIENLEQAINKRRQSDIFSYWRKTLLIILVCIAAIIGLYKATENTKGTGPTIHYNNPVEPNN